MDGLAACDEALQLPFQAAAGSNFAISDGWQQSLNLPTEWSVNELGMGAWEARHDQVYGSNARNRQVQVPEVLGVLLLRMFWVKKI